MMTPRQAIVIAPIASILLAVLWLAYGINADAIEASVKLYVLGWLYQFL